MQTQSIISLCFPSAPVEVRNNTRLRMFPKVLTPEVDASPAVECIVGPYDARVIFEVKRAALDTLPRLRGPR